MMIPGRVTPFELACHSPEEFARIYGEDADDYLRAFEFDPDTVRRTVVKLTACGRRKRLRRMKWHRRLESQLRVQIWRDRYTELARRRRDRLRLLRLRSLVKDLIAEADDPKQLKRRYRDALRFHREDCETAPPVSSAADVRAKYAADLETGTDPTVDVADNTEQLHEAAFEKKMAALDRRRRAARKESEAVPC